MKTFDKWTATLTLAAVSALALTQGGPPPGGPGQGPGGPGGGFQRGPGGPGMRGGMMGGGPMLLRRPEVQKELKLTSEQIEKLNPILGGPGFGPPPGEGPQGGFPRGGQQGPPPPGGGFPGGPPQGGPGGGFQGGPPQGGPGGGIPRGPGGPGQGPGFGGGQERVAQLDKQIKTVLNDSQFARYQQLALQFEGPAALMRKEVADKVGLSQEKRDEIGEIFRNSMGGGMRRGGFGPGGGQPGGPPQGGPPQGGPPQGGFQGGPPQGDFDQMRKQMDKQRQETNAKILAVLSAEEKSKWNALLGKEFKFEVLGPPRGGDRG